MSDGPRSAELLQIIAATLGTDVPTLLALRHQDASGPGTGPADDPHPTVLLMRMVKAFQSLPDEKSRLQALRIVETLANPPGRVHGPA